MLQIANYWQPQSQVLAALLTRSAFPTQQQSILGKSGVCEHAQINMLAAPYAVTPALDLPVQQALLTLLYRDTIALSVPCSSRVEI